jgi:hypothetical protein
MSLPSRGFIKKEALMRTAVCSACGAKVNYAGEQSGQTALCTGCNENIVLRQSSMQVVQAAISVLLAAISICVLVFFGLVGGIVAWATHGTLIVIMGVLAIIFGMRVRDVFLILTLYLWMTVVGRAMLKSGRASRGATDPRTSAPFLFARQGCGGLPYFPRQPALEVIGAMATAPPRRTPCA